MERVIIHSDLDREMILPKVMWVRYLELLEQDIVELLPSSTLTESSCPVTGESMRQQSFKKIGMTYRVSANLGNIYISPRPDWEQLKRFYRRSKARQYWLTDLWAHTRDQRQAKVILPRLEWTQGFMSQFLADGKLRIGEYMASQLGYCLGARTILPKTDYELIAPLISLDLMKQELEQESYANTVGEKSLDVAFLFEALERSPNPKNLLSDVVQALKPGGLCFITCLLTTGLEAKILGADSNIFLPPERMNLLSFEGMNELIRQTGQLDTIEFSTPGVLDISNVTENLTNDGGMPFLRYILKEREDTELLSSFQDFLQINRLGTSGRLVLRKV